MHAVVVRVTINNRQAADQQLRNQVVPGACQVPGFRGGYWTGREDSGLSMVVFDSQEAAEAVAKRARSTPADGVTVEEVEVREVMAQA